MDDGASGDGFAVGAARRVLVAEDEPFIALDLAEILRGAGHAVLGPCASVADALAVLAAARPDVALLDVTLADGPAAPVAEALRAAGVPFALATGHGDGALDGHACYAGARRLTKAYGEDAVARTLAAVLGTVRPASRTAPGRAGRGRSPGRP